MGGSALACGLFCTFTLLVAFTAETWWITGAVWDGTERSMDVELWPSRTVRQVIVTAAYTAFASTGICVRVLRSI